MADPQYAEPVKLFAALLWKEQHEFIKATELLCTIWGQTDFTGANHLFDVTSYYEPEMGSPLFRTLIAFRRGFPAEKIGDAKHTTNEIEKKLTNADRGTRAVNIDIGYLNHNIFILASAKYGGQKIYLGNGMYVDLMGRYRSGKYQLFEWAFMDFRTGRYDSELLEIRKLYLSQREDGKNH